MTVEPAGGSSPKHFGERNIIHLNFVTIISVEEFFRKSGKYSKIEIQGDPDDDRAAVLLRPDQANPPCFRILWRQSGHPLHLQPWRGEILKKNNCKL